ncbi:hypothetical protein BJ508DRAFT_337088 [Ascobolus immersus RN42]|uniref:OTU domain-containing protein n=1 Tax=Ascobolus immersus RN42 TaxID=1160509 RepID=A0A3N4HAH6_ASCIM|nr:hypothetical protein BJ508DRAFT_337088 [Ascobolus immersus RN42]
MHSAARPVNSCTRTALPQSSTPVTNISPIAVSPDTPRARQSRITELASPTPYQRTAGRLFANPHTGPSASASRTKPPTTPKRHSTVTDSRQSVKALLPLLGPSTSEYTPRPSSTAVNRSGGPPLRTPGSSVKAPISIPSDDQELHTGEGKVMEIHALSDSTTDDTILKFLGLSEQSLQDETVGDGINCGFKALAAAILGSENMYQMVRQKAHAEFCKNEKFYMGLGWFEKDRTVAELKRELLGQSPYPRRNWFRNPIHTRMIANAYSRFIGVLDSPDAKTIHIFGPSTSSKSDFFAELLAKQPTEGVHPPPNRLFGICLVNGNHWKRIPSDVIDDPAVREKLVRLHRDKGLNPHLTVTMIWDGHMFK